MKTNRIIYITALILSLGLITACSEQNIAATSFAKTDMKNYKTFAWLPPGDTAQNDLMTQKIIGDEITARVNDEMQNLGYTLEPHNPDLLVLMHTKLDSGIALHTFPSSYYYYSPSFSAGPWYDYYYPNYSSIGYMYGPSYIAPVEYTEGTIIIDLIDAKTKQVIWRGSGSEDEYSEGEARDEILDNIDEIFDKFPG